MKYLILFFILILPGYSSATETALDSQVTDVMWLIEQTEIKAAESGAYQVKGFRGEFLLPIKSSQKYGKGGAYLHTELDPRDRRNLTIRITPKVVQEFELTHGTSIDSFFVNKTIKINGTSKRITGGPDIYTRDGLRLAKGPYRISINVSTLEQLTVIE